MPRQERPNLPDTWHHVMNRGADRQDVFVADADFRKFEWLLGDAAESCGVEVHAYCLMTNHFHLLLHCPNAGLSEVMQSLQFRYAQWFNHRYERDGPVFKGRFTSVVVATDEQLLTVGRYIHRNPLALVACDGLADYRWSSLASYLDRRPVPGWLSTTEILGPFGGDIAGFAAFVETDVPSDHAVGPPREGPTHGEVEDAVCEELGVDQSTIRVATPGAENLGRALAICLSVELRVSTTRELVDRYGLSSLASVRTIARRGRTRAASDRAFAELRRRVLLRLGRGGQPETLGA